jgi:hypothetical protein
MMEKKTFCRDLNDALVNHLLDNYSMFSGTYFGIIWTINNYLFECHVSALKIDEILTKYDDNVDLGSYHSFRPLIKSCKNIFVEIVSNESVSYYEC